MHDPIPSHRTVVRAVRWSPQEWQRIRRAARRARRPPSVFIREKILRSLPASNRRLARPRTARAREDRTLPRSTRFRPSEWKAIQEQAALVQMSPARYMHAAVLGHRTVHRADAEAIHQLARVGNNLNQIARHANTVKQARLSRRLAQVLAEIERAIRQLAP